MSPNNLEKLRTLFARKLSLQLSLSLGLRKAYDRRGSQLGTSEYNVWNENCTALIH